jgi:hypothetical protein
MGLEGLCAVVGLAMPDSGTPRDVHALWILALVSIPVTGMGSVLVVGRKGMGRGAAGSAAGMGALVALYWGWHGVVSKFDPSRFAAGLISSMAFMSALLLLAAGVQKLRGTSGMAE